jgi:LPXTG-site transpeptidase (sortase) family protein
MEGTLYDRRMIRRPAPRPVSSPSTRRQVSGRYKAHTEIVQPKVEKQPIEIQPQTAATHFSKVTPVYQTSTTYNDVDKVRAHTLSMDLIQLNTSKKVHNMVPEAVVQPIHQPKPILLADLESVEIKMPQYFAPDEKPKHHSSVKKHHKATSITQASDISLLAGHNLSDLQRQFVQEKFRHNISSKTRHRNITEKVKNHAKKIRQPRTWLAVFLFGIVLSGAYATFDSFSINQQAREALAKEASASSAVAQPSTETSTPTTINQAAAAQVPNNASTAATSKTSANYSVAPDLPRFIKIPKLGINAPIVSVGLASDGSVGTPSNIYEAAWYNGSTKPGTNGASFIDAHSSASGGALFGHLDRLTNGDKIQVQKGDGSTITYQVMSVQIVPKDSVDMASMLRPFGSTSKGLNLITCQGNWIDSEKTLTHRVLVYTQQVS